MSTNKTEIHDKAAIVLKVILNTHYQNPNSYQEVTGTMVPSGRVEVIMT
jgi:hypothetical protein